MKALKRLALWLCLLVFLSVGDHIQSAAAQGQSLAGKIFVIDPGHGFNDTAGSLGHPGAYNYPEKNAVLAISMHLREMLLKAGATVVMTRSSDENKTIQQRVDITKASLPMNIPSAGRAISIHLNGDTNPDINLTVVLYMKPDADCAGDDTSNIDNTPGKIFAQKAAIRIKDVVQRGWGGFTDGTWARNNLGMVCRTWPQGANILTESAYITNLEEADKLIADLYATQIAYAHLRAIGDLFNVSVPPIFYTWYLAEGFTGHDEYLLIMNPTAVLANVTLFFIRDDGTQTQTTRQVAPRSRASVYIPSILGAGVAHSTKVEADQPVVVERSSYFWQNGNWAGTNLAAVPYPSSQWYFAEGYTGHQEFITILNPNAQAITIRTTFLLENAAPLVRTDTVSARRRFNLYVNSFLAANTAHGTVVEVINSDNTINHNYPIVAERVSYFNNEGHSSSGSPRADRTWYLAEGSTQAPDQEFVAIINPGITNSNANLTLKFWRSDGTLVKTLSVVIPSQRRYTLDVAAHAPNTAVSISVEQGGDNTRNYTPIVVERAMYRSNFGGYASSGATYPARSWSFAEGSTASYGFDEWLLIHNPSGWWSSSTGCCKGISMVTA